MDRAVIRSIALLCSPNGSFINGKTIVVDGGIASWLSALIIKI
jgi:NAD(P)-dependent dehydrogenase (short-subunit alcohol dehydrogenase family)